MISPNQAPVRPFGMENRILEAKFSEWLEILNYSPNSRRAYGTVVKDFCLFLGPRSLLEVERLDIRKYLSYLVQRGLSESSLDQRLWALRTFYAFLRAGDKVKVNVASFVTTRKRPSRRLPQVISIEDVERLIQAGKSPRDRAVLEVFYASGGRVSDLIGMRVEDLDLTGDVGSIKVLGKGNKERIVLIGGKAAEALRAYLGNRREGPLFRESRAKQQLRVTKAKPNKHESGVWWRGAWIEYPKARGRAVTHWKWLGRVAVMTESEAQLKLLEVVGSAPTVRPPDDRPLDSKTLYRIVRNAATRAGLKGVSPHSIRHAFATHLLNRGANIRYVQELLGHSSLSTTQIYTHIAVDDLIKTHAKFHPRRADDDTEK